MKVSSRVAGLALVIGLCAVPSRSDAFGWPYRPIPVSQSRYEELTSAATSALAGRSFEYWADRELHGPGQCDTPESDFRPLPPQLKATVTFSRDGRAVELALVDKSMGTVSLQGYIDRRDGNAVYLSSTVLLSFRASVDGSPVKGELTHHGFGLCVVRRTRGTLRPVSAPGGRGP